MDKFKQGYAKAQSEIEKDKFVIKCMEVSKEVGYAKAIDDVKKIIDLWKDEFIFYHGCQPSINTFRRYKEWLKQEIAKLEKK